MIKSISIAFAFVLLAASASAQEPIYRLEERTEAEIFCDLIVAEDTTLSVRCVDAMVEGATPSTIMSIAVEAAKMFSGPFVDADVLLSRLTPVGKTVDIPPDLSATSICPSV